MDEREFVAKSDACLGSVVAWLEKLDPDEIDYNTGDGIVTMEFPDDGRFILSRQSAARQIWLAAGAQAWHYGFEAAGNRWIDDKDGHELFSNLARVISEKLGHPVEAG
jgi:CyaY protein